MQKTKRSIEWVVNQKNKIKYAGTHLIADFWYGKTINNEEKLRKILVTAAKKASATPLKVIIHTFAPQGITGVVLLAESHIAVHAWPEYDYMAIDIFTCGDKSLPEKALEYFKKEFSPKRVEVKKIKRGVLK